MHLVRLLSINNRRFLLFQLPCNEMRERKRELLMTQRIAHQSSFSRLKSYHYLGGPGGIRTHDLQLSASYLFSLVQEVKIQPQADALIHARLQAHEEEIFSFAQ